MIGNLLLNHVPPFYINWYTYWKYIHVLFVGILLCAGIPGGSATGSPTRDDASGKQRHSTSGVWNIVNACSGFGRGTRWITPGIDRYRYRGTSKYPVKGYSLPVSYTLTVYPGSFGIRSIEM